MENFKETALEKLKSSNGFTIIELMIVVVIIAILGSMAYASFSPMKSRAYDAIARSDIRNFAEIVVNAALGDEDVDFEELDGDGGIGVKDNSGNPRPPIYTLSPGVTIDAITGSTQEAPGDATVVLVTMHHVKGTPGKTFDCTIDENTGLVDLP